jgi:hypothetical protein
MPATYPAQETVPESRNAQLRQAARLFGSPAILLTLFVTIAGIIVVHPTSIANFIYYFVIWSAFILALHKEELPAFSRAFIVNSLFISIFYLIQTSVYPESYGTTSPYGSWTDDSFFFSLTADRIPAGMELRDYYFAYSETYSTFMRMVSLLPINHPMDLIFFQSGIGALLSTFSRRYALQETGDLRVANATYYLTMLCPFLMMNGGVILVRDTFAAALFVYSLSCINDRRWIAAIGAVALQVAIRPGTALILIPAYFILNLGSLRRMAPGKSALLVLGLPLALIAAVGFAFTFLDLSRYLYYFDYIGLTGRDFTDVLTVDPSANQILVAIQDMPFWAKFPLNGAYMFIYPFFSMNTAFGGPYFDVRYVTMNFVFPVLTLWFNAWFFAGVITRAKVGGGHRFIVLAFVVTLLLVGTYSLQSRHKTIIQPLYYLIAAIGWKRAGPGERQIGYVLSGVLLLLEIGISVR